MRESIGAAARFQAVQKAAEQKARKINYPSQDEVRRPIDYYGCHRLSLSDLKKKLPKEKFEALQATVDFGKLLDPKTAEAVAEVVREWAIGHGVTHFCHWFHPQTGLTAEKHDAFLSLESDGRPFELFSGSELRQSEPDASSFPSGGMRTTFEARGYTAWDPSSPVFIVQTTNQKTLCVPSVFISYYGDALDEKTSLMRSGDVLSDHACEILKLVGTEGVKRVVATLGTEQEYFLIDKTFAKLRPDLVLSGRTLLGAAPPKGQQLEDHYFGSIPSRVQAFMAELEYELYRLGVPVKTRHNEVAPNQFEIAPIFEEANIAADHNQLTMAMVDKVANRHGFAALLHEKPFAGINGSGKHNNWSLAVTASGPELNGKNLLNIGKTHSDNLRFLAILAGILKGVHKHAGLLRASIASAGNDHRLGANEAPPSIISVFLGDFLTSVIAGLGEGESDFKSETEVLRLAVKKIPAVMQDNTDRNRTSPFAFTGNKFEFRAVGSAAATAFPVTILNAAVADGFSELLNRVHAKKSDPDEEAIYSVVKEMIQESKPILFEGNNYSEEWVQEAKSRGLPNLKKTPEALKELVRAESREMLTRLGVMSEQEIESRYLVRLERYIKTLLIEFDTLDMLVSTQVLPAAYQYQGELAQGVVACQAAGVQAYQKETLIDLNEEIGALLRNKRQFLELLNRARTLEKEDEQAEMLAHEVSQKSEDVRACCDRIEGLVADDLWALPKYREMLFFS